MHRFLLVLAAIFVFFLPSSSEMLAQGVPGLSLESPILPTDMSSATMFAGEVPVGSAIPGGVAQATFTGCPSCGSVGCTGCDDFGPGYSCPPGVGLWFRADYLIWYEKNMDTIPLVTTSTGIPVANPDDLLDLDADETSVLFGGRSLNGNPLEGWRLEVGTWLNADATYGIFGRYYEVGNRSHRFRADSSQTDFLGLPYFNFDSDQEDSIEIAVRDEIVGAIDIEFDGEFRSWEILFRRLAETGCNYRMDWIYGYRNTRLHDSFNMSSARRLLVDDLVNGVPADATSAIRDSFEVKNQFHGFDFGVTGHSHEGCWSLDFLLKVALGVMDQEITVDGSTINQFPGNGNDNRAVLVGGLFSQETNFGKTDRREFGVIPEFDINLGYAFTPNIDLTIGYTFIYMNSVVRAGTAMDRVIDSGLLGDLDPVNSNRPQLNFDDTSYYIHGLNLGMTARF